MNLWRKSMKLLNTYTLDIKKSKFIAYFYQISSKEEVKEIYETLKKKTKKPAIFLMPISCRIQPVKPMIKNPVVPAVCPSIKS